MIEISDDLIEKVSEAEYEHDEGSTPGGWYKPWAEVDKNTYWDYVRRARAGLAAVVPLIRAQVAAERRCVLCNPGTPEEIRQREEASAELDRLIVDDDEDLPPGVHRERDGFLVMERNGPPPNLDDYGPPVVIAPPPDEPVADVVAAFEAGEKGVTRRPVSATAIRGALYDSLSPNFEIDSDGYDDAAVAVALLVDGVEP